MATAAGTPPKPKPAQEPAAGSPTSKVRPKYRLTQTAYINETLYEPERQPLVQNAEGEMVLKALIIEYDGEPGAHMVPVNAPARAMYAKHPPRDMNPVDKLSILGPGAETIAPGRATA